VTKILERVFEAEHVFGIIFTLDGDETDDDGRVTHKADDPFDEATWIKANPMIGITPTLKWFRGEAADAKASPSSEGNFKTKNLNIWLNAAGAWLNMAQWQACADPALDWSDFDGLECCIGADLADKDDITALALAAIDAEGRLLLKPLFYLPEAVLRHPDHAEGKGPAPYRTWQAQGHLILSEGDWVDHNVIEAQIREWIARFSVRKVTFDQFAAGQAMASRLNENPDDPVAQILHKSAANVTDPAKDLEARVKAGPEKLRHDGNPVLAWMASNTVVSRRVDGSIIPKKETPMSPNKIDGIDAAVNAIAPMVAPPEEDNGLDGYIASLARSA
jgi:phage terminase large subunit-like protein